MIHLYQEQLLPLLEVLSDCHHNLKYGLLTHPFFQMLSAPWLRNLDIIFDGENNVIGWYPVECK